MHEMSIAEGVIQVIEEQAKAQAFSKVKALWLEVGPMSMVESDALRFCFEAVSKSTIAEGAVLEIIELKGQGWCLNCHNTVEIEKRFDECPKCGSYQIQVTSGDELRIKELEVV
ncbi:hydrogenase maturation nickel metallochaperone HypA [Sessilibacter corallicola]|uniref:Hydrogenase maturation factor HypA n=1 Tax=Sessilibacter corallicola TaxID=2904075 RepID=A0ABQ0A9E8_9GAMM